MAYFFSSRRRHTRCSRDWSSDVCSSDLQIADARRCSGSLPQRPGESPQARHGRRDAAGDRKSTRLNSSHGYISYAVFCLKKKKKKQQPLRAEKNETDNKTTSYLKEKTTA